MARRAPSSASRPFRRDSMVAALGAEEFDVLVVGGGITGAGVALDASARGMSVALVEAGDFGAGTSSKSSKLVHGGLRYLQQGDVRLVYQALRERRRLLHNAPHLVSVLPFLLPILTKDGLIPRPVARALGSALWMYDLTGGWRIGRLHRRLRPEVAHADMPTIPRSCVAGAYLYYDATVDDARLVLTVVRTAVARGAVAANRCRVTGFEHDATGRVCGARVDAGDDVAVTVRARSVVNATGVWADELAALDARSSVAPTIRPAKGVHVTLPWACVRNDIAAVVPVPGDRRSLFVVPWGPQPDGTFSHAYVGTTDTDYTGPLDEPHCTGDDIDYLLGALNAATGGAITPADITGTWAGLRPLMRDGASERTADLSRRHRVTVGDDGMVGIAGGKLTTYREMAADTIDAVAERLDPLPSGRLRHWWRALRRRPAGTTSLPLLGAERRRPGLGPTEQHLAGRYGTVRAEVTGLAAAAPDLNRSLVAGLPYSRAEAVFAVRHEMATTLVDVVTRRTRCHLIDRAATVAAAPDIAHLLGIELGWTDTERERQVADYLALAAREVAAADRRTGVPAGVASS